MYFELKHDMLTFALTCPLTIFLGKEEDTAACEYGAEWKHKAGVARLDFRVTVSIRTCVKLSSAAIVSILTYWLSLMNHTLALFDS